MDQKTALVIIDAQTGLIEGLDNDPVFKKEELLSTMKRVLDTARELEIPVIYVQDLDVGEVGSKEFEVHPHIAPIDGEVSVHKMYSDAFRDTSLQNVLEEKGIHHLVIMGCKTEYCVDTTCRKAVALGYDVTLVSDGHSTTDNGVLSAEQIIAHHNKTLRGFDSIHSFIMPRPSDEDIFVSIHNQYREE